MTLDIKPNNISRLAKVAIPIWWFVFAVISLSILLTSNATRGEEFRSSQIVWHSSWAIWSGLTFPAIRLARAYPLDDKNLGINLVRQFFIGFLVVFVHMIIEHLLSYPLRAILNAPPPNLYTLSNIFRHKVHINLIIYWSIVGTTNAFDYYWKYRKMEITSSQLETKLAKSELQSLKMQLQPHFLFNTHNSIISLMHTNRSQEAIEMLTQLSGLLRLSLQNSNEQTLPFSEELKALDLYIGIQKVRFGERINFEKRIQPETLKAEFPYLCLQPIVENSIKHGIEKSPTSGEIRIDSSIIEETLIVTILDNGTGLEENVHTIDSFGIGIRNTETRLQHLYGNDQNLTVQPGPHKGTLVSIKIPFHKTQENSPEV
ncbi:histidine kinase [Puniceicoccaceae bacterium K14]|nr:histidine kinase [Puniceicoccaceae bacterium K14]